MLPAFGLRPRFAPDVGAASDSGVAVLGGRPGFFLMAPSVAAAAGAIFFVDSVMGGLVDDLDAGTVLTLDSGLVTGGVAVVDIAVFVEAVLG